MPIIIWPPQLCFLIMSRACHSSSRGQHTHLFLCLYRTFEKSIWNYFETHYRSWIQTVSTLWCWNSSLCSAPKILNTKCMMMNNCDDASTNEWILLASLSMFLMSEDVVEFNVLHEMLKLLNLNFVLHLFHLKLAWMDMICKECWYKIRVITRIPRWIPPW